MPPKRLSSSEKQEILQLYRQPEETTSTLASRFGVSSSTVSRILKQGLSSEEYDILVQQKRTGVPRPMPAAAPDSRITSSSEGVAASRRILMDVGAGSPTGAEPQKGDPAAEPAPGAEDAADEDTVDGEEPTPSDKPRPILRSQRAVEESDESDEPDNPLDNALDDEPTDDSEDDDIDALDEFQDDLDGDDDFGDLDDDLDEDEGGFPGFQVSDSLEVRPIAEARLPRTCYLVIDRSAELITRPLSDFADLGHIPSEEVEEKTLPVFDNHRVARRFSNRRMHRIVKVPDSRLLQKTTAYLQAKGITRLLFDGQVYDLSDQN